MIYKINIVNSTHDINKYLSIILLTLTLILAGHSISHAVTVTLQWGSSSGASGYKVYYRADSSTQPFQGTGATQGASPINVYNNTSTTISGLDPAHSYYFAVTAYDSTGTESSYSNIVYVPELTSPSVSLSNPPNNTTISGTINITPNASDNVGVTKVEYYINGILAGTNTSSPYTLSWNTTSVSNGTYSLYAKAYDAAGNSAQSDAVTVTVNNTGGTYTVILGNSTGADFPNTIEDTYINLNNSVNAASANLNTYTWPANKPANAILMKWDISAIPAGAQIQSATLSLYMNSSGGDSLYNIPVSKIIDKSTVIASCNGYSYDGNNPWDPSSVPYNGIPLAQSDIASPVDTQQINTTLGYKNWNITGLVQDWMSNPSGNYGLLFNSSTNAASDSYRSFASSEATDPSQRPKLTVTYTIGQNPTLFVTLAGDGSGNVNSNAGFICESGTCADQFDSNSIITLIATPVNNTSSLSYLSGWTGDCSSISGSNCTITMNSTKYTTATFTSLQPVHLESGSYYSSLQTAYSASSNSSTIQAQAVEMTGNLSASSNKALTIKGGYNATYSGRSGYTVMKGALTVGSGSLVVDNLVISN